MRLDRSAVVDLEVAGRERCALFGWRWAARDVCASRAGSTKISAKSRNRSGRVSMWRNATREWLTHEHLKRSGNGLGGARCLSSLKSVFRFARQWTAVTPRYGGDRAHTSTEPDRTGRDASGHWFLGRWAYRVGKPHVALARDALVPHPSQAAPAAMAAVDRRGDAETSARTREGR